MSVLRLSPSHLTAATAALLLAGCATTASAPPAATTTAQATPPAAAPRPALGASAPTPGATPTGAPVRPPVAGQPPPFAEVTRGATRTDGYLPLWTRDDKTWIEIPAERLDQPMFFGASIAGGLGERGFFPGLMGREHMVVLRRVGNSVQLVARNLLARAPAGTPLAQAVAESYSDSLLGVATLAASPHLQNKALLVDAAMLFGGDLVGMQTALESATRMPYGLDRANSSIERARAQPAGLFLTVRQHYAVPRLPASPVFAPGAPPPNPAALPNPPSSLPDGRSLFLSLTFNLVPMPAQPMATRKADPRVGYFTQSFLNFGDDTQEGRRTHFIERWRLEKKDPGAALSEPKEPIRVVLDRNIPERWRAPLREAALEWNKAFEGAGFRNALTVEQQAADADWTTLEGTRILSVRWFAQNGPGSTAVGPSQSDPRTGELLRGAAIIDENRVRVFRARAAEVVPRWADTVNHAHAHADGVPTAFAPRLLQCSFADEAFDQAQFAMELLTERGLLDPNSPEADRYIEDALKNVAMHEIGHALGLRHNFRASTAVTASQLRDPAFTASNPISSSIMDYNGQNLPLKGEPVVAYNMNTLGAYDRWAIEFGYREYASADEERRGLQALAARAEREPALAYATDEDLANNDPLVNHRDMGDDPLAFAQRQITLARELYQLTTTRQLDANEDLSLYRRAVNRVLGTLGVSLPLATKHVGGTYTERAMAGAKKPLLVPVPAAKQRAALDLVVKELFTSASFSFEPQVMSRLGVDQYERFGPNRSAGVDFSLPTAVLSLQRGALDQLMSDSLASRLADAESKVADPLQLLSYADVQDKLSSAVWSELSAGGPGKGEIDSLRRNLQREHLRRLASGLLRPASAAAADVRSVNRQVALQLQAKLGAAVAAKRGSSMVRAHLEDSLATLNEALKAPLLKQGV
ncbi:MAG: zinc-dependent metalloprotease [Rubrivivax sp.]|nr:zinc-dependent metalloprotease [Rubrivivax sp.]